MSGAFIGQRLCLACGSPLGSTADWATPCVNCMVSGPHRPTSAPEPPVVTLPYFLPNHAPPEPPVDEILRFFTYEHLPAHLQGFSKPFADMATWITETIPRSEERSVALRKLLECKDAAVRASLPVRKP